MPMRYKVRRCEGLIFGSMCAGWMSSLESDFRKLQLDDAQKKKVHSYILFLCEINILIIIGERGVMVSGGCNENCNFHLKDVDFFSFSSQTWTSLPPMNKVYYM